ncbi:MAG TPA: hypothetical protein VHZ26_04830 [Caulobacteraceae bacterium]|jgi:hypothetical protein|nr:hypothetical protein [Caulobacteraceae bacterium]
MTRGAKEITTDADAPTDLVGFVSLRLGGLVALKIQEAFGGRQVYVPSSPEPHNIFSKLVGQENAEIVASEFGSGQFDVSSGPAGRAALIREACLTDRSAGDIAKVFGCSSRWVRMKRAKLRREGLIK